MEKDSSKVVTTAIFVVAALMILAYATMTIIEILTSPGSEVTTTTVETLMPMIGLQGGLWG